MGVRGRYIELVLDYGDFEGGKVGESAAGGNGGEAGGGGEGAECQWAEAGTRGGGEGGHVDGANWIPFLEL